jgi:hypothetical protein
MTNLDKSASLRPSDGNIETHFKATSVSSVNIVCPRTEGLQVFIQICPIRKLSTGYFLSLLGLIPFLNPK